MQTKTCHDAYDAGRALRAESPLKEGRYKLSEARSDIDCWLGLALTITERLRTGTGFESAESLGPCMSSERGSYLKSIPERLARLIAYKILPGIAALEGDGIAKTEVERLMNRAYSIVWQLIAECEAVRLHLKTSINREYNAMRRGESPLIRLLVDAMALTEVKQTAARSDVT